MIKRQLKKFTLLTNNVAKMGGQRMYNSTKNSLNQEEIKELLNKKIDWEKTGSGEYPLFFKTEKYELKIKVNDFPNEPLYSLLVNDKHEIDLESLPSAWQEAPSMKK